jgi:hypothetical protein
MALWVLAALVAGGLYLGPDSPVTRAAVDELFQCRANIYGCRDFSTQLEAQIVYRACGGPQNDIHHLDRDLNGFACDALPWGPAGLSK